LLTYRRASPSKAPQVVRPTPQQSAPAYQHRHRPDVPEAPAPKSPVKASAGPSPAKPSTAGGVATSTTNTIAITNVHLPADGGPAPRSSGGSSHTADEVPKLPARVGGFAFPSGPVSDHSLHALNSAGSCRNCLEAGS
jgi:hypothetical protein